VTGDERRRNGERKMWQNTFLSGVSDYCNQEKKTESEERNAFLKEKYMSKFIKQFSGILPQ